MKLLFYILAFVTLPYVALAQEEVASSTEAEAATPQELTIGTEVISYDETFAADAGTLYYRTTDAGAQLVASVYDTNGDDAPDVWIQYGENEAVVREAHDTDNDGSQDLILAIGANGVVSTIEGSRAEEFTAPAVAAFTPDVPAGAVNSDLVGDLDDITVGGNGYVPIFFIILFVAGAAIYWFLRRQRER
jgi:hypothetical protein